MKQKTYKASGKRNKKKSITKENQPERNKGEGKNDIKKTMVIQKKVLQPVDNLKLLLGEEGSWEGVKKKET